MWTTQILARINLVTDSGQSALTFFEIAALILPSVLPVVMPFAMIIAVAQTLTVMNTDSELVVISAAGGSRMTIIRPVMLLAVLASVFSFAVDNGVDPYARQRGRELVAAARADFCRWSSRKAPSARSRTGCSSRSASGCPTGGSAASSSPIRAPKASTSSTTPRPAP